MLTPSIRMRELGDEILMGPIDREWHALLQNVLLLAQKLTTAAQAINEYFSDCKADKVTSRGLYETLNPKLGVESSGCHKYKYYIQSCELNSAHIAFESIRKNLKIDRAIVIQNST